MGIWSAICKFFNPPPPPSITVNQSFPKQPPLPQTLRTPSNARTVSSLTDLEVVARTIWGEARDQGEQGMTGVGCVILNRSRMRGWMGNTPREVCLKPYQFSCWNPTDPNRVKMLTLSPEDPQYGIALRIANEIIRGTLPDITGGADSYQVHGTGAYWAKTLKPIASIGDQDFYRTGVA